MESRSKREVFSLEQIAEQGIGEGLEVVKRNFENRDNPAENLDFHNFQHTTSVVYKTEKILLAMRRGGAEVAAEHIAEGKIAGAFYDTVQNWKAEQSGGGAVMRKRAIGGNERASAELDRNFMEKVNREAATVVFDEESVARVEEAIMSTVPGFDRQKKTVIQPNLKETSSFVARALALADLGTAGMEGYLKFGPEGDALFREENLDIAEALRDPEEITPEQKEYFRGRMIAWSKFQPLFAEGRKALFESELEGLPEGAKEELRKLFDKFDDAVTGAKAKAAQREKMTFDELALDMGYRF